mmetsp:Transcript_39717/g.83496  ORF Transcript_39717/g.83496 Transcript_39717/m.83496 type:complete len:630 (+) Transcript_39717:53-1942(+)
MNILPTTLRCVLILASSNTIAFVQSKSIEGDAAPGNWILKREYTSNLYNYHDSVIDITSNVPVTIQRYYDDHFIEGEQPFRSNEAKVLVTSNCAATTYVPQITWGVSDDDTTVQSINVNVQGILGGASMPYLASSSYHAIWNTTDPWCQHMMDRTWHPTPAPNSIKSDEDPSFVDSFKLEEKSLSSFTKNFLQSIGDKSRRLFTNVCDVNVEVMLDGCSHSLSVTAPKIRVMDAVLENTSSQETEDCVYDHTTDIAFPGPPVVEGTGSLNIASLEGQDGYWGCYRPVPGRPFVDSSGSMVQASSLVVPTEAEIVGEVLPLWSSENNDDPNIAASKSCQAIDNSTANHCSNAASATPSKNQLNLSQEWTTNALGEHSSIASFSAFSIALLTNAAPSNLVEDALHAALDEVRHAKTSFEIASKLSGGKNIVRPGALPESKHVFLQDLTTLALAVAREGCVDETLSALEAAAEADLLRAALVTRTSNSGTNNLDTSSKYADIDEDVLKWIHDELQTIALEESKHAALAWRTLEWACRKDEDACRAVRRQVLNENEMEAAFRRRFGSSFSGSSSAILQNAGNVWRKMIDSHVDGEDDGVGFRKTNNMDCNALGSGNSLVSVIGKEVCHGILRG